MSKISDNEILRQAIEMFIIQHFDTIELAGSIKQEKKGNVNYYSIDLNEHEWDGDVEDLNAELSKYLTTWVRKNHNVFEDYISLADITIEYLLPEKESTIQNKAKSIRLFYLPAYYYSKSNQSDATATRSKLMLWMLDFWNVLIYRNLIISTLLIITLSVGTLYYLNKFPHYIERISKVFEFTNIASGVIASFILGYIVTKVTSIRGEKLRRAPEILKLSNQLTYFRKVCFNFLRDHDHWNAANPNITSFKYGESIKNLISYEDFNYPSYNDPIKYAKYRSLINDHISFPIVNLVLQLHLFADEDFLNSKLLYTEYPANYIYTLEEMDRFILLNDSNHIWYCCEEGEYFPETFPIGHYSNNILSDLNRIDNDYKSGFLTKKLLSKVSLDFQYRILPRLNHLIKLNESPLPPIIAYFRVTSSLILVFGIIVPSIFYMFLTNKHFAFFSSYVVLGIIVHILLSLGFLLRDENTLDRDNDYM